MKICLNDDMTFAVYLLRVVHMDWLLEEKHLCELN